MDTPNTLNYMIGGYTIFAIVLSIYVISLLLRWRCLKQDLKTLEGLGKK